MARFVLLLVVLAASLAGAGPSSLVAVDAGSAPAGQPYYGRVGRFALLVDGPGERIALDQHRPSYVVFLQKPGIESQVSAVAPVLLRDRKTFLMQLNDEQASRVRLAGCELFRLPDTPVFLLPAAVSPPLYPRPFRPDSFIQRLVNRVSADSIEGHMQRLVNFHTRYSTTDSCRRAEQFVHGYFQSLGLDSVALDTYDLQGTLCRNVIGMKRGTVAPERLVIVCGHMDCESENHNVYAPGAEDNASGTAMAMEAARVLASEEFETSVMFIAFTGEEQGLWGSFFFVQDLFMAGRPVVGALNFDMIAWPGGQNGVALHCDTLSQTLAEFEARMADLYTTLDCSIDQEMYGSDQIAFMYFDYPATAGAEYGDFYPWYHTTGDTMGNCSFALAAEVARVAVAAAASLGAAPAQPPDFALRDAGTGGRLHASWLDSPSPDVVHYKLLWGTQSLVYTDSVVLGLQTSYDITGLANGTRYYATVIAIDAGGREGFPAAEQSAVPGEWPLAPAGFAVMPIYWGNALFWQPNQELDLAGYNLYRSTSPSAGFARLNSGLIPDTTWRDSGLLSDTMYYYYVTAVDTQTYESDTSNHAHARPITLDHGILLVDETRDGNGTPGSPSDAQQDDFYHNCLRGSNYTDWDCAARGSVPLAGDVGPYSTIVWHSDDYTQQFMRLAATGLANYLAQGGRLWFMGWKTLAGLYPPNYPYPITTYPGEFAHDWLHVALAMLSPTYDFTGASGLAGYPSVTCDSAKMYPSMHGRLSAIEALTPTDAEPVLTFNSFAGDTFQDKPVATRWLAGPGRMVHFGFPLYYMHDSEARPLAIQVLTDLGEPIGIAEKPNTELPTTPRLPTLVRRVLNLPASLVTGGSYLFTPAGRRVLSLRSGPNDISSLAPGIYFVRQSAGTPRVSKIVVTR